MYRKTSVIGRLMNMRTFRVPYLTLSRMVIKINVYGVLLNLDPFQPNPFTSI